jgi:predicted phage tail protein
MSTLIAGAGGGKDGGGGHTPTESADNLKSIQYAEVLDLIGEGEMQGLVNGLKSVYLDNVPIQNEDGSYNFTGVSFVSTNGTQGQAALPGFKALQNEVSVGVTILQSTPLVRSISNPLVDQVRVTISVPQLSHINVGSGDIWGTTFEYAIDIQSNGGGYVEAYRTVVGGKTMSRWQRAVVLDLPGTAPWDIRLRRLTAPAPDVSTTNNFAWDSFTEIQTVKLRYPNSVVHGLRVSAQQFGSIPVRTYDMLGLRIQIPANYNAYTRAYTGAWNGSFSIGWTNNPAWVFYDLCTNPRYGLGDFVDATLIDKWELYSIAQYCDALVPNGRNGTEPRFTCNVVIQTREEAYKVLQDIAGLFRGMSFWGASAVQFAQDAPATPEVLFSPANVVDGLFSYASTSAKQRHSVAMVYWNNPADFFKRTPEVVVDDALVAKYGIRQIELNPIGITSRGQAIRLAKWALFSEDQETDTLMFKTGLEGGGVRIGKVFKVADPNEAGERLGGRVRSATTTAVQVDSPVTLRAGEAYTLTIMRPDTALPLGYTTEERSVTTAAGVASTLTVTPAFSLAPAAESVWVLASNQVAATLWRCLAVKEVDGEPNVYAIEALSHKPDKYGLIEQDVKFEKKPVSRLTATAIPPINLSLSEVLYRERGVYKIRLTIAWQPGAYASAAGRLYNVAWRLNGGAWEARDGVVDQSIDISGLDPGLVDVAVRSTNALGNQSLPLQGTLELLGKLAPPHDMTGLALTITDSGARLSWNDPSTQDPDWEAAEIGQDGAFTLAQRVVYARTTTHLLGWLSAGLHSYYGRHWDTVKSSVNAAVASVTIASPIAPPIVRANVDNNKVFLQWLTAKTSQPLRGYSYTAAKIVAGAEQSQIAWGGAGADSLSDTLYFPVEGDYKIYIRAVDVAGNIGPAAVQLVTVKFLQVAYDQLSASLASQVDLISGLGAGSVNARITAEAVARAAAVAAEAVTRASDVATEITVRSNAVLAEANARAAAVTTETAARQAADTAVAGTVTTLSARTQSRPNLLKNGGFEFGLDDWLQQGGSGWTVQTSPWGPFAYHASQLGTGWLQSAAMPVYAGESYTISADSLLFATSGNVFIDLRFYTSANVLVLDGTQRLRAVGHNFSHDNTGRIALEVTEVAPANAAYMHVRLVWLSLVGTTAVGFRQVKVEQGGLPSTLYTSEGSLAAAVTAIKTEETARTTADTAETLQRTTLAAQLRGTNAGSDINALTEGLLYQERVARVSNDAVLSQQITLLSAGAGEQFDYKKIWYFDADAESWGGNGPPTAASGFLRAANATPANIFSPAGLAVTAAQYTQIRIRIRKTGTPTTWAGLLWWARVGDGGAFVAGRRISVAQPTYDANGIGLITANLPWDGTIDQINIDLFTAQTATNYVEVDWVAIGRPSPGASAAALLDEQTARAAADLAEATSRQTLSSKVTGVVDPSTVTLGSLASGLLFEERTARSTQDTALATSISNLTATVSNNASTNTAAVNAEAAARAAAESAEATARTTLASSLMSRPNLCPAVDQWGLPAGFYILTDGWGKHAYAGPIAAGTYAIYGPPLTCFAFNTYTISGDTVLFCAAGGFLYFDIIFYDDANVVVRDGGQNPIYTEHNYSDGNVNRLALQVSAVAPPSAVTMRARFVAQLQGTATALGFRQVKVEQGGLPASLYSEEAALQSTNAALVQEASTRATAVAAEVAARTALEATVTNPATGLDAAHAAVQTNATAQANVNGQLSAQYTVKTDVAGLISGYGLASTANNATPSSAFGVRANSFYIAAPATAQATAPTANLYNGYVWLDTSVNPNVTRYRSGTSWVTTPPTMPFVVQTTPVTLPSGVVLPPGVFMQTAFIQDASITSAKIESLTVDKLAAGSLAVGAYAQSTNYVAGVSGWRLSGDGTSQLPAANILGKLTTAQIEVGAVSAVQKFSGSLYSPGLNIDPPGGLQNVMTLTTTGAPVYFSATVQINLRQLLANVGIDSVEFHARLVIDGVVIQLSESWMRVKAFSNGATLHAVVVLPIMWQQPLAAGAHNFSLQWYAYINDAAGNNMSSQNNPSVYASCFAMENKV